MAKFVSGGNMGGPIIVAAEEPIGCPKCGQSFPVSEGLARQTMQRPKEDYEGEVAVPREKVKAELKASRVADRLGPA